MYTYMLIDLYTHAIFIQNTCLYINYIKYIVLYLSKLTDTRRVLYNKLVTLSSIQFVLPVHSLNWNLGMRAEEKGEKIKKKQRAGEHDR